MNHETIIEAAARALRKEPILFDYPDECLEIVRVVLTAVAPLIEAAALEREAYTLRERITAAVTPLIRAQALEEAAVIIENDDGYSSSTAELADAIRTLKEQP